MTDKDYNMEIIRRFEPILDKLNLIELSVLNRMVVDRIKIINKAGTFMHMSQFNIGDHVAWTGHNGEIRSGVIMKLNQKTATIHTKEGIRWNVSPQLLRKEG